MLAHPELAINEATYQWSVRLFSLLRKILKVDVELHHDGQMRNGDIFLFNHFARLETFIPQYFIHQEVGSYCRSVASGELLGEDDPFSNYLRSVGAVPNDLEGLLVFLASEILHGRKVIVFPEGGMVKDRRVIDERGAYSVYSRTARERRKHHTGAAVLALGLEFFKEDLRRARDSGNTQPIERAAENLGFEDPAELLDAVAKPTLVVPANITFYPIRVSDNLLRKGAELLSLGLSRRHSEELLIEGNILLKETDMDIRLGRPVNVADCWNWWQLGLVRRVAARLRGLDDFFNLRRQHGHWDERLLARLLWRDALRVRDDYMHRMYMGVTVNLSHLASRVILQTTEAGETSIELATFHRMVYLAVKYCQREPTVELHQSLRDPGDYRGLLDGSNVRLEQFLRTTKSMGLIDETEDRIILCAKLQEEHGFDEMRLENLIEVYANEVAPLRAVCRAVASGMREAKAISAQNLASLAYSDMRLQFAWDREEFSKTRHGDINRQQTATRSPEPYLLLPESAQSLGIVLVHGFLASPAELRDFGDILYARGHPVVGVRLRGHGTSPWDLRERSWEDWLESLRHGFDLISAFAGRVCVVGFSTGGALSLLLASQTPAKLAGVAAVCVPVKFQNKSMRFVSLVHSANSLVRWVSSSEGIMPFRPARSEHPDINYAHMPIRGLYELQRLVDELEINLPAVKCPVCLIQADQDPIVTPGSAERIVQGLSGTRPTLTMKSSRTHGIVNENIDGTHDTLLRFIESL